MNLPDDRRKFCRFEVKAPYSPLRVRTLDHEAFNIEGNAYDVSEGGIRFELDRALPPGTPLEMEITLPEMHKTIGLAGAGAVHVFASVVWLEDEEDPAPYKMAATFTRFARPADAALLRDQLMVGRYRLAA